MQDKAFHDALFYALIDRVSRACYRIKERDGLLGDSAALYLSPLDQEILRRSPDKLSSDWNMMMGMKIVRHDGETKIVSYEELV